MSEPTIGVMLTAYKRTHLLEKQVAAVRAQTVKPDKLALLDNSEHDPDECFVRAEKFDQVFAASKNAGVWPRFMLSPMLGTDYIAVFDDDTIPGPRWFENCLKTLDELDRQGVGSALLGTVGVSFVDGKREQPIPLGWKNPEVVAIKTDIVGHAWFFDPAIFDTFNFAALCAAHPTCGEDYWLSYAAQKQGWPVVCPPHPPNDKDWWGSIDGMRNGMDSVALCVQPGEVEKKSAFHEFAAKCGMKFDSAKVADQGVAMTCWEMPHIAPTAPPIIEECPMCGHQFECGA